jgi:hypothetical protein
MRRRETCFRVYLDVEFVPDCDGFVPLVPGGSANRGDLG